MYWKNIIPVFLAHAFNVKLNLCIVNYMIISNIHNWTPKSGILFTDICIGDFFNGHNFMCPLSWRHWVEVMSYYNYLWSKIEPNRIYEWLRAKWNGGGKGVLAGRREVPFTIYSLDHTNYLLCKGLGFFPTKNIQNPAPQFCYHFYDRSAHKKRETVEKPPDKSPPVKS